LRAGISLDIINSEFSGVIVIAGSLVCVEVVDGERVSFWHADETKNKTIIRLDFK